MPSFLSSEEWPVRNSRHRSCPMAQAVPRSDIESLFCRTRRPRKAGPNFGPKLRETEPYRSDTVRQDGGGHCPHCGRNRFSRHYATQWGATFNIGKRWTPNPNCPVGARPYRPGSRDCPVYDGRRGRFGGGFCHANQSPIDRHCPQSEHITDSRSGSQHASRDPYSATRPASTNAAGPRRCAPRWRRPSSARPARPAACRA